jgi:gamma-glutamylputrescine oxidase
LTALSLPFWSFPTDRDPGRLPEKTDVLVVGGGISGVSLLHHLEKRGIDAILVERSHLASGASGRNAGFLLAGVADCYVEAVRTYGREKARDVWAITGENHDRVIEAAEGQHVGHRRLGSVTLAASDGERRQLEESHELLQEDGFESRWDGEALLNPKDGEVDPAALVGALARRARRGAIREGVNVTAIEPGPGGVTVRAREDECRAGAVILATNAYTPLLVPHVKIQPTRAQMLASAPISRAVCGMPTYSHFGYRYWRQMPSGEVLIGGWRDTSKKTEITYEAEPSPAIQGHLDGKLAEMAGGAQVTHRWAGIMGFTESGLPLAGPLEGMPNVHICAGFNGHGMGFAFMTAKGVVEGL